MLRPKPQNRCRCSAIIVLKAHYDGVCFACSAGWTATAQPLIRRFPMVNPKVSPHKGAVPVPKPAPVQPDSVPTFPRDDPHGA